MQKHRFVQNLIIIFCLVFISAVFAQQQRWYSLYVDNNITELQKNLAADNIKDPQWEKFVKNLFVEDLDVALPNYLNLYESSSDPQLRKLILDRVSQYYYSKGFYETATRIMEDEQFRQQIFSTKKKKIEFGVQIGAFSTYKNALNLRSRYSKHIDDIFIVSKNKNGQKLYVVIAGKFEKKREAEDLKDEIRKDYSQKGIVVQY